MTNKPWETGFPIPADVLGEYIKSTAQLAAARALYGAMEKDKAIVHNHHWWLCDGKMEPFPTSPNCPACKYKKLLWPEGRNHDSK